MSEQLSVNARKQQEEDIERLVKCRLRSEIEARKAVESTMKRAVQEARELKKELVLLRQEKEELRAAAQKSAGSSGNESARNRLNDSQAGKQSSNKAAELKLKQQVQTLTARNKEIEAVMDELQQRVSALESQNASITDQSTAALAEKDYEIASLQEAFKKSKLAVDETKRKCQKLLREKREEMGRALQENEQLARNAKTLQSQLALLPQLKKKLELAKEKRADVAEVWQKKLEQRDQSFLHEEAASKQKLAESAAQIIQLTNDKLQLQEQLDELELRLRSIDSKHQSELSLESRRMEALEASVIQLKEKLAAAVAAAQDAERAEVVARETQVQETRLRQLAEDAADAVELRAEKAERDLAQARMQLDRLEEALEARGVTLEYLLKQQTPVSIPSRTSPADRGAGRPRVASTLKKSGSTAPRDPARSKTMGKSRLSPEDTKNSFRTTKTGRSSSSSTSNNNNNQEE